MSLSLEERIEVILLCGREGWSPRRVAEEFNSSHNRTSLTQQQVARLLEKFKSTGSVADRPTGDDRGATNGEFSVIRIAGGSSNLKTPGRKEKVDSGGGRQVISLHVGQAGVQMGLSCWELYCLEHEISPDGEISKMNDESTLDAFYSETPEGKFIPRTVFVDLEPTVIDEIRHGPFQDLFHAEDLIAYKEDAANVFSRGLYGVGRKAIESVIGAIRKQVEACSSLQGLIFQHSFGGGTGSGFMSLMLEKLTELYPKTSILRFAVFPSPKMSSSVVEPYNAVFHAAFTMAYDHPVFMFDNEAIYNVCKNKLGVGRPSFVSLNRHIAQVVSSSTASMRYDGDLNVDMRDFSTNLIPLPRLHFPIVTYAPVIPAGSTRRQQSVVNMTEACFDPMNQMASCDPKNGKYFSCCLLYRGDVMSADVNRAKTAVRSNKDVQFFSWCPGGLKIGLNGGYPKVVPGGDLAKTTKSVCMMASTTAVREAWARINHKFDLMYSKNAFVHWFVGEGLEGSEFTEAREKLTQLENDFLELEGDTSDEDEDDEF